jgi:excisionase family DNA binding protein
MYKRKQQETVVEKTGQYISTLEAAKMCGVSTFSIQRWFDEGILIGARLPGGKRKITAESLKRFMKEHGLLPSESATAKQRRVLIVDQDARTLDAIKEHLAQTGEFLIQTASNGLDAGLAAAEFRPDMVIINVGIEDIPATSLIQRVHQFPVTRDARLIAIANKGTSAESHDAKKAGADSFLTKPLDMKGLGKAMGS